MPIRLGSTEPSALYLGSAEVQKAYLGSVEVFSAAPPFDPSVLLDGLVAWWDFEEESGTRVDAHGVYDLTDNNGVGVTAGRTGTNAAAFVGASSQRLTSAEVNAWHLNKDLSLVIWARPTAQAEQFVIGQWGTQANRSWNINLGGSGQVRMGFRTAINNNVQFGTYTAGAWNCIQFRYDHDAASVQARVGGGGWTTIDVTGLQAPSEGLSVGGHPNDSFFSGAHDAPAVWHRYLTDEEMNALLNGYQYSDLTA